MRFAPDQLPTDEFIYVYTWLRERAFLLIILPLIVMYFHIIWDPIDILSDFPQNQILYNLLILTIIYGTLLLIMVIADPLLSGIFMIGMNDVKFSRHSLYLQTRKRYLILLFKGLKSDSFLQKLFIGLGYIKVRAKSLARNSAVLLPAGVFLIYYFLFTTIIVLDGLDEPPTFNTVSSTTIGQGIFGIGTITVAILLFFLNYLDRHVDDTHSSRYIPISIRFLALTTVCSLITAMPFLIVGLYSSSQPAIVTTAGILLLLISVIILISTLIVILTLPLRGGFHRLRKKAARDVIYQNSLKNSYKRISMQLINDTEKVILSRGPSKKDKIRVITASMLDLSPGEHITDIKMNVVKRELKKYGIEIYSVNHHKSLGDKIQRYNEPVINIEGYISQSQYLELSNKLSNAYLSDRSGDIFRIGPRDHDPNPLDDHIANLESLAKQAIENHNESKWVNILNQYRYTIEYMSIQSVIHSPDKQPIDTPIDKIFNSIESLYSELREQTTIDSPSVEKMLEAYLSFLYMVHVDNQDEYHNTDFSKHSVSLMKGISEYSPILNINIEDYISDINSKE